TANWWAAQSFRFLLGGRSHAQAFDVRIELLDDAVDVTGVVEEPGQHQAAFEGGGEQRGEVVGVDVGADGAGGLAVLDDAADHPVPAVHGRAGPVAQLGLRVVGFDRGVHDRAAAGDDRVAKATSESTDHRLQAFDRVVFFTLRAGE